MIDSIKNSQGRNVIGLDTAKDLGELKSFVVDVTVDRIERLHVAGRRKHSLFTEWGDIEAFGDDAVMVRCADAPSESDTERDVDIARGNIDVIGARVLDTAGFEQGIVDDVEFDVESGAIVRVITSTGASIAAADVASLGSYALVVRH